MRTEEEKARLLLDEEEDEDLDEDLDEEQDEEETEEENEEAKKEQENMTPAQQLRELTSGKLILMQPFRAHSQDVTELPFDFCGLTTDEMMTALDSVPVNNLFAISNQQAMALFAATAAKCAPKVEGTKRRVYDERDIKRGMGAADAVKAVQLAKLFYNASSQAGGQNISKE